MANMIIKPAADGNLLIQDRAGGAVLSTSTSGATIANATLNSPTMVTPALGTPTSGNLTNCTNNYGMWKLVTRTAITSAVAQVVFTNLTSGGINCFVFASIDSASNGGEDWNCQISENNGSSFITGSYKGAIFQFYSSGSTNVQTNTGGFTMADGFQTSTTASGIHGFCYIHNLGDASQNPMFNAQTVHLADSSNPLRTDISGGIYDGQVNANCVRFLFTSGNISGSDASFITHYKQVV